MMKPGDTAIKKLRAKIKKAVLSLEEMRDTLRELKLERKTMTAKPVSSKKQAAKKPIKKAVKANKAAKIVKGTKVAKPVKKKSVKNTKSTKTAKKPVAN